MIDRSNKHVHQVQSRSHGYYCCDRSAAWRQTSEQLCGTLTARLSLLYGTREIAENVRRAHCSFRPMRPGGLYGLQLRNGYSHVIVPGKWGFINVCRTEGIRREKQFYSDNSKMLNCVFIIFVVWILHVVDVRCHSPLCDSVIHLLPQQSLLSEIWSNTVQQPPCLPSSPPLALPIPPSPPSYIILLSSHHVPMPSRPPFLDALRDFPRFRCPYNSFVSYVIGRKISNLFCKVVANSRVYPTFFFWKFTLQSFLQGVFKSFKSIISGVVQPLGDFFHVVGSMISWHVS